jgi:hypothetical protein
MRGNTLSIQQAVKFEVEECCNCGVAFAMTEQLRKQRLADKESFYCPNGHGQSYTGKTDAQKAKEAEAARREALLRLDAERDQRLAAERELKRHQDRTKGGVCPCCNRSFVQLARHMKTKHPDFAEQARG